MSKHAVIDTLEFAEKSLQIHGRIALLDLERLSGALFSRDGALDYSLTGKTNALGKPQLDLRVTGNLQLVCQRCLQPLPFAMDAVAQLVLVADEAAVPLDADDQDETDYIVADQRQPVLALIEDEVLLSLPLAPAHATDECVAPLNRAQVQKDSPFKILQGLKGKR